MTASAGLGRPPVFATAIIVTMSPSAAATHAAGPPDPAPPSAAVDAASHAPHASGTIAGSGAALRRPQLRPTKIERESY